jgi:hypothetical protein
MVIVLLDTGPAVSAPEESPGIMVLCWLVIDDPFFNASNTLRLALAPFDFCSSMNSLVFQQHRGSTSQHVVDSGHESVADVESFLALLSSLIFQAGLVIQPWSTGLCQATLKTRPALCLMNCHLQLESHDNLFGLAPPRLSAATGQQRSGPG